MTEATNDDAPAVSLPRAMWQTLEPYHAMIYFAPEARPGLQPTRDSRATGWGTSPRAPPAMGPVPAGGGRLPRSTTSTHRWWRAPFPDAWRFSTPEQMCSPPATIPPTPRCAGCWVMQTRVRWPMMEASAAGSLRRVSACAVGRASALRGAQRALPWPEAARISSSGTRQRSCVSIAAMGMS